MLRIWKKCLLLVAIGTAGAAMASAPTDVPSCYAALKMPMPAPSIEREIFVLLDQTTPLDANLQRSVMENVGRLVQPGTAYSIATFSAFGQGRYLELLSAGTLEQGLSESVRNSVGVKLLRSFDTCLVNQQAFARKAAAAALQQAMSGISADYAKSDVLASIKEMSSRVQQSQAPNKIFFLVSDMLENSGVSSFYANRNVRMLKPADEMKKAEAAGMLANLAGSRVFVLGAGLVQDVKSKSAKDSHIYRDPKVMATLKDFWSQYFERSQARLQEFGMPALVVPVN